MSDKYVYANGIGLIADHGIAISFATDLANGRSAEATPPKDIKKVTVIPDKQMNQMNVAFWGGDNQYPQRVAAILEKSPEALSMLDFKAKMLYGQGIIYGTEQVVKESSTDKDGMVVEKHVKKFKEALPGEFPMVDKLFDRNNNFHRFFMEFNQDWTTFINCFPLLTLSNDRTQVNLITHYESSDCRYEQMDGFGRFNNVYVSKYWAEQQHQFLKAEADDKLQDSTEAKTLPEKVDNDLVKKIPAIDMYDSVADLKAKAAVPDSSLHYILPVNYPSVGKTYYQKPVWTSLILSGWLDIAISIPEMLKALYTKSFNVKYHIAVPDEYLRSIYADYDQELELQPERREAVVENLSKFLSGAKNSFKTMVTFFKYDHINGKEYPKVTIEEVANTTSLDKDLLLTAAIDQKFSIAFQMNPAIMGASAPGARGAGSGSDIREAFLVYNASLFIERQIILEPIKVAARFNGAPPELVFRFKDIVLTTLDENSGSKEVVS